MAASNTDPHVTRTLSKRPIEDCVICLFPISERAIASPCNHSTFDFICLASWASGQPICPLCKQAISTIEYDWRSPSDFQTYTIPKPTPQASQRGRPLHRQRPRCPSPPREQDPSLLRRHHIYRHNLYSQHIGSSPATGFRPLTPGRFARSPHQQSRAALFLRRDLRILLPLLQHTGPHSPSRGWAAARRNNAEHLIAHVVDLLRVVPVKGGEIEDVLAGYVGRSGARLLLHELAAWLRSPFERLEEWDAFVRYPTRARAEEIVDEQVVLGEKASRENSIL